MENSNLPNAGTSATAQESLAVGKGGLRNVPDPGKCVVLRSNAAAAERGRRQSSGYPQNATSWEDNVKYAAQRICFHA
jgi:hypothetical protein